MKNILFILLLFVAIGGQSQSSRPTLQLKDASNDSTLYLVEHHTEKKFFTAPKIKGFHLQNYGGRDTIWQEWTYEKYLDSFRITDERKLFNFRTKVEKAFETPDIKIQDSEPVKQTEYSNFFLIKNEKEITTWVTFHSKEKTFEIRTTETQDISCPWFRLLILLGSILFSAKWIANILRKDFITASENLDRTVLSLLANLFVVGITFTFLFEDFIYRSYSERVIIYLFRIFLIFFLSYVWEKRLKEKEISKKETVE